MNYSTVVVIEDFKPESMSSSEYNKARAYQVQTEINRFKVDIDRTVFKKTKAERVKLKEAKLNYEIDTEKGRNDIIEAVLSSEIPKFNISVKLR